MLLLQIRGVSTWLLDDIYISQWLKTGAKKGRWVAKSGRWVAKLVARLLATADLSVRIQTSLKNTKGRQKQRSGQHTLARQKYIEKYGSPIVSQHYYVRLSAVFETWQNSSGCWNSAVANIIRRLICWTPSRISNLFSNHIRLKSSVIISISAKFQCQRNLFSYTAPRFLILILV